MRIDSLYGCGRPVFSFEFFPPKTDEGAEGLMRIAADLKSSAEPDFISVTYGAGGSTRDRTHSVVTRIQSELGVTGMAHLTCSGSTRDEIRAVADRLAESGVENVLALRGDPPQGSGAYVPTPGGFAYATDLIAFLADHYDLSIGAACYPETHPEATSPQKDLEVARAKQDAGAGFLTTQLFFDNQSFFTFQDECRSRGIEIPIVPGIMPITEFARIKRITSMCGAKMPDELATRLEAVQDDAEAQFEIGVEHAIAQCSELLSAGVPGIHFYALNKSEACDRILEALGVVPQR